jgi:ATP-dependent DNA helicase RecG
MPTTLDQIIAGGESEQVEFKESLAEVAKGIQAVVGMLNSPDGGMLLFGVKDDGTVVGVSVGSQTHDRLHNEFRKIDPSFVPHIETHHAPNGKAMLVVPVPGSTGLYRYDGRAYIRFGASTRLMAEVQYQARLLERVHAQHRWETLPAPISIDDLDADEIILTIDTAISNGRLADPETREVFPLLRGLNLLDETDRLLNAGAVLFGKSSAFQREYPQSRLRMARFRGGNKSEFVDNRQVVGNILALYQRAQEFLLDHIRIAGKLEEGKFERTDVPGYPLDALREALANALCHRDYTEGGGAVDLAIYDDRIEIVSSGTLHFGLTIESLLTEHQSRPWNPVIADVLFKRGVIESWDVARSRWWNRLARLGWSVRSLRHRLSHSPYASAHANICRLPACPMI